MQFETVDDAYEQAREIEASPEEIAERLDYDGEVGYAELPGAIGGVTIPRTRPWEDDVVIEGSGIRIAERYRDQGGDEYLGTVLHELVHGKQYEEMAGDSYTPEEMEALLFLHEGQAVFNADGRAYPDGEAFFEEFYDRLDHPDEAGAVLDAMDEEYYTAVVQLEDDDGAGVYQLLMLDQEVADQHDDAELYEMVADEYGLDVDIEESYEVDLGDMDTEKLGDHIMTVQEELEQRYRDMLQEDPELLTDVAVENLDLYHHEAADPAADPAMA